MYQQTRLSDASAVGAPTATAAPARGWRRVPKFGETPFVHPPIRTVPRAAVEALVARLVAEGIGYGG